MKKTCLIIIGILSVISSNGQTNKFSIGLIGSSDLYNYRFNQNELVDIKYNSIINYSAGISVQYNLNEKLKTKTGLLYSKKDFTTDINWQLNPDGIPDPEFNKESNMKLAYLEVPVLVSHKFINGNNVSIFASFGLITSFLIKEKEIDIMQDGKEKESDFWKTLYRTEFNPILFNIDFEIGLNYYISETVFLSIEPYYRYALNKISDEILKSNPMSYGLKLGLNLKMNSESKSIENKNASR
ncbi:MAG TPA: porin family protein [Prolixibacteraceae bacterium]|jgi:hypothetical protein